MFRDVLHLHLWLLENLAGGGVNVLSAIVLLNLGHRQRLGWLESPMPQQGHWGLVRT